MPPYTGRSHRGSRADVRYESRLALGAGPSPQPSPQGEGASTAQQDRYENESLAIRTIHYPPLTACSQVGEIGHRARFSTSRVIQLAAYQPPATKRRTAPPAAEAAPTRCRRGGTRTTRSRALSLPPGKEPRRGTALDRVYGYHVERGSLDAFIKSYQDRLAKNTKDGAGWLILGLLEGQRGQDAAAVAALRQAETTRPDDPLPSYYLGQALVLVGQPEQAAGRFRARS